MSNKLNLQSIFHKQDKKTLPPIFPNMSRLEFLKAIPSFWQLWVPLPSDTPTLQFFVTF